MFSGGSKGNIGKKRVKATHEAIRIFHPVHNTNVHIRWQGFIQALTDLRLAGVTSKK